MVRNDDRPDRVGFKVVTNLAATGEANQWSGRGICRAAG